MLYFSLGSRLRGNDGGGRGNDGGLAGRMGFVHPHPNPLPSRERGCTRSRLRGNDGGWRERGFNCDVKDGSGVLCFSLGSRLRGNDGGFTLTLGPPISPWEGEGDGSRERGWFKENAPVSPRGRFPILSCVL